MDSELRNIFLWNKQRRSIACPATGEGREKKGREKKGREGRKKENCTLFDDEDQDTQELR